MRTKTTKDNLISRFDAGESVLDYFDTDAIMTITRLAKLKTVLNLSAVAREAGIPVATLQAKIRRMTPLTADETRRIVGVLRKYNLQTAG